MCKFIKDNGEQCGIDIHDGDYCHLHEREIDSKPADSNTEPFDVQDGVTYCDECKIAVMPTVLELEGAAFKPNSTYVTQGLACGCQSVEYEWSKPTLPNDKVPDSWL